MNAPGAVTMVSLTLMLFSAPPVALAQQAAKVHRIGVLSSTVTWVNRRQIRDLAIQHRLPAIYWDRTYALDGGLMSYGEDEREVPRRLAVYVDKILMSDRGQWGSVEMLTYEKRETRAGPLRLLVSRGEPASLGVLLGGTTCEHVN